MLHTSVGTSAGQMGAGSNATITEEMYRASLLSAVEDKIRRRLREVFDQAQVRRLEFSYCGFLLEQLE